MIHQRAGRQAEITDLIDVDKLLANYYQQKPDISQSEQLVIFGTSGHRGSASKATFNENHILAIAQAIADYRHQYHITGPCFIGKDTHALSEPALKSVIEVFAANQVETIIAKDWGNTPTPVISHAIIQYNKDRLSQLADGIVITPSHNPPEDGGIKYNSVNGGPADTDITTIIQTRANTLLKANLQGVKRVSLSQAVASNYIHMQSFEDDYINDLSHMIDMSLIAKSGLKMAVDPLGGAGVAYWQRIAEQYRLSLEIVNKTVDPQFAFMPLDHDGVIRMDCSSAHAMSGLLKLKDKFDLAFGNDTDFDRHGIVTPEGLMSPNAYLATCVNYLFTNRPLWQMTATVGKTVVTSTMIDYIAKHLNRELKEFPVGFKWYTNDLSCCTLGFACEESAGATFLRQNGQTWTTDKDGIVLCLLAAEMTAKTQMNPQQQYKMLEKQFGKTYYGRIQAPADFEQRQKLAKLDTSKLTTTHFAGAQIEQCLTHAPTNQVAIGGIKVVTAKGWFAARPSGTEDAYKIYAESLVSLEHLKQIEHEAQELVSKVII